MRITGREKIAIFALAAGLWESWKDAYINSRETTPEEMQKRDVDSSIVTRWKQRTEVQKAWNEAQEKLQKIRQKEIEKALETERGKEEGEKTEENAGGNKRTKETKQNAVDYYDPKNQRTQINRIIQEAQDDPKTQLDAIKAIQQTQRDDRQAAREGKTVRVYLPLTCDTCPLAAKAREKAQK